MWLMSRSADVVGVLRCVYRRAGGVETLSPDVFGRWFGSDVIEREWSRTIRVCSWKAGGLETHRCSAGTCQQTPFRVFPCLKCQSVLRQTWTSWHYSLILVSFQTLHCSNLFLHGKQKNVLAVLHSLEDTCFNIHNVLTDIHNVFDNIHFYIYSCHNMLGCRIEIQILMK